MSLYGSDATRVETRPSDKSPCIYKRSPTRSLHSYVHGNNNDVMDHYFFLSNNNSLKQYPNNIASDFTVELPRPFRLKGNWECALVAIELYLDEDNIYLCTDICEESFVEDTLFPVLRWIRTSKKGRSRERYYQFDRPMYVPLKMNVLTNIRLFIRGPKLRPLERDQTVVRCSIHLRPAKQ